MTEVVFSTMSCLQAQSKYDLFTSISWELLYGISHPRMKLFKRFECEYQQAVICTSCKLVHQLRFAFVAQRLFSVLYAVVDMSNYAKCVASNKLTIVWVSNFFFLFSQIMRHTIFTKRSVKSLEIWFNSSFVNTNLKIVLILNRVV